MRPPSRYAQRRMTQRNITAAEIDHVLANPHTTYPSKRDPSRLVVQGETPDGRRRLKVVVLAADPEYVITVADRDD